MSDKPMLYLYYEPYSNKFDEAIPDGLVKGWLDNQINVFRQKVVEMFPYHQAFFATDNVFGHLIQAVADGLIARDEFAVLRGGYQFVMDEYGCLNEKETGQPLGAFTTDFRPSAIYLDAHIALTMGTLGKETA